MPRTYDDLLDPDLHYRNKGGKFWLALDSAHRVIGCIGCVILGNEDVMLHRLYVKPQMKRRGIRTQLLDCAQLYVRECKSQQVLVHLGDPMLY